jgi:hypothetical protein
MAIRWRRMAEQQQAIDDVLGDRRREKYKKSEAITKWAESSMLEDNQFVMSHVRNGVNEAKRLFADQKLRVDRLMAAGEEAQEAQQMLCHWPWRAAILGRRDLK